MTRSPPRCSGEGLRWPRARGSVRMFGRGPARSGAPSLGHADPARACVRPLCHGGTMSADDSCELTGEEWRQWMADRLATRAGKARAPRQGRPAARPPPTPDTAAQLEADAVLAEHERPRTRGDCAGGPRPCPWAGCRYHLYLEVSPAGTIKLAFPDLEPWDLEHSCALDLADDGGMTLEAVAQTVNVTRERVRQIEDRGKRLLRDVARRLL